MPPTASLQALADIKLTGEALKKKLVEELDRCRRSVAPAVLQTKLTRSSSGRITREEADALVRMASEQAARRAEQEFIEQEMLKVVVKSLDDGGSVKAVELTASPIIGSTELMKKQASHMQVLPMLMSIRLATSIIFCGEKAHALQATIREANRLGESAEASASIDHTGSLFIKCLDDGQVRKVKDVEKTIDVVGTPTKGKGDVEESEGTFSGVGLVLWQAPNGIVFVHRFVILMHCCSA